MSKATNPIDTLVGSRVRMQRLIMGLSQGRVAAALGVTFQQVQKYENGANRISASRLQQIADLLEVPVAFFFEGASQATPVETDPSGSLDAAEISMFLTTAEGIQLVRAFVGIKDAKARRKFIDLAEVVSDRTRS